MSPTSAARVSARLSGEEVSAKTAGTPSASMVAASSSSSPAPGSAWVVTAGMTVPTTAKP